MRYLYSHSCH